MFNKVAIRLSILIDALARFCFSVFNLMRIGSLFHGFSSSLSNARPLSKLLLSNRSMSGAILVHIANGLSLTATLALGTSHLGLRQQ
jgi:hypothetical protein